MGYQIYKIIPQIPVIHSPLKRAIFNLLMERWPGISAIGWVFRRHWFQVSEVKTHSEIEFKKNLLGEETQTSQALIFLVTIQVFIMIGTRPCIGR